MNEKQQYLVNEWIAINQDEIIELVGATEGGWDWVMDSFGHLSHDEILTELNRMFPGDDNDYLAWSINEQFGRMPSTCWM